MFLSSSSTHSSSESSISMPPPMYWADCKTFPEKLAFIAKRVFNDFIWVASEIISKGWNIGKTIVQAFMIDVAVIYVLKGLKWVVVNFLEGIAKICKFTKNLFINETTIAMWNFTADYIGNPGIAKIKQFATFIFENVFVPIGKFLGGCCKKLKIQSSTSDKSSLTVPLWLKNSFQCLSDRISPVLESISKVFNLSMEYFGDKLKAIWDGAIVPVFHWTAKPLFNWSVVPAWNNVVYPILKGIGEFFNAFIRLDTTIPKQKNEDEDVDVEKVKKVGNEKPVDDEELKILLDIKD